MRRVSASTKWSNHLPKSTKNNLNLRNHPIEIIIKRKMNNRILDTLTDLLVSEMRDIISMVVRYRTHSTWMARTDQMITCKFFQHSNWCSYQKASIMRWKVMIQTPKIRRTGQQDMVPKLDYKKIISWWSSRKRKTSSKLIHLVYKKS